MKTNHRATILIASALIALILSACGPAASAVTPSPAIEESTQPPATEQPTALPEPTSELPAEETFSVTVTDGLGTEVTLNKKPQRIVSMTLGTDEILLDLVGPERLGAITYLASDPTTSNIAERLELAQIPNVIQPNPSPEQIIALEPDLVFVATFTDPAVIQQLRDAGMTVFAVGFFSSVEAIQQNILTIGEMVGEPDRAAEMVAQMDAELDEISQAVAGASGEKPTVLYLASQGWVAGSATTTDDIITRAGGVNAAAALTDWNQVSEEAIIEMDPAFVILSPYVTEEEFIANPVFADMAAVREGHAVPISDAYMSATSQYIVRGVRSVAHLLYPDLVPEK